MVIVKIRDIIAFVAFLMLLVQSGITYHLKYYENVENIENSYKEPHIIRIAVYTLLVIFSILTLYINNFVDNNVFYHSIY